MNIEFLKEELSKRGIEVQNEWSKYYNDFHYFIKVKGWKIYLTYTPTTHIQLVTLEVFEKVMSVIDRIGDNNAILIDNGMFNTVIEVGRGTPSLHDLYCKITDEEISFAKIDFTEEQLADLEQHGFYTIED